MSCYPNSGIIQSYTKVFIQKKNKRIISDYNFFFLKLKIPIKFFCKSKVLEKYKVWSKNFALVSDKNSELFEQVPSEEYSYSAIFEYESSNEEPTIVHLLGSGTCPVVKLSKAILQFGEVKMNEKKDIAITLENNNPDLPIEYNTEKVIKNIIFL